ncbi:hypothetical protein AAFF_G00266210 [Aldrovandia affinis]|uniref:Uncharacterized protein n=1 Tax=Aldrovandia affinis TaxID=143900 RepID=A0AAD7RB98_9TELE|nr:hypothetical protein AAFF_G00266210 [Aldrovandia affinis]
MTFCNAVAQWWLSLINSIVREPEIDQLIDLIRGNRVALQVNATVSIVLVTFEALEHTAPGQEMDCIGTSRLKQSDSARA